MTRSGNVGKVTVAHSPIEGALVSDDLLRIDVTDETLWGWIYALLRAKQALEMMGVAQYGHVIKHLEVSHLSALPAPILKRDRRDQFSRDVRGIFDRRDRAHALVSEAEHMYESALGGNVASDAGESGFVVPVAATFSGRRRLDAAFYNPRVAAIEKRCAEMGRTVETVRDVTEGVWWITRFKRVFGAAGVPYLSAEELFSLNQPPSKRVLIEQASNAGRFFVKAGWLVMARSGQVYGMNGSVAIMTERHERAFLSDDFIRIVPAVKKIRAGYLFIVLGHPRLGRPLVIRNAYGTSIPHLDPEDVSAIPVVRLPSALEHAIADLVDEAVSLRRDADELEDRVAADAGTIVARVIGGDLSDLEMVIGQ